MIVTLKNGEELEFPEGTSTDKIKKYVYKNYPQIHQENKPQEQTSQTSPQTGQPQETESEKPFMARISEALGQGTPRQNIFRYGVEDPLIGLSKLGQGVSDVAHYANPWLFPQGSTKIDYAKEFGMPKGENIGDAFAQMAPAFAVGPAKVGSTAALSAMESGGAPFLAKQLATLLRHPTVQSAIPQSAYAGLSAPQGERTTSALAVPAAELPLGILSKGLPALYEKLRPSNIFRGNLPIEQIQENARAAQGTSTPIGKILDNKPLNTVFENITSHIPFSGVKDVNKQLKNKAENTLESIKPTNVSGDSNYFTKNLLLNELEKQEKIKNDLYLPRNERAEKEGHQLDLANFSQKAKSVANVIKKSSPYKTDPDFKRLFDRTLQSTFEKPIEKKYTIEKGPVRTTTIKPEKEGYSSPEAIARAIPRNEEFSTNEVIAKAKPRYENISTHEAIAKAVPSEKTRTIITPEGLIKNIPDESPSYKYNEGALKTSTRERTPDYEYSKGPLSTSKRELTPEYEYRKGALKQYYPSEQKQKVSTNEVMFKPTRKTLMEQGMTSEQLKEKYRNPTLTEAQALASVLYSKGEELLSNPNKKGLGKLYKSLSASLSGDIKGGIEKRGSTELKEAQKIADENYKKNYAPFKNKEVAKLLNKNKSPEKIVREIIRPSKELDQFERIEKIQNLLPPDQQNILGYSYLKTAEDKKGNLDPKKVAALIDKMGNRQFNATYKDEKIRNSLLDYKNAYEMNKSKKSNLFTKAIPLIQLSHFIANPASAIGTTVASNLANKVFQSQNVRENLINKMIQNAKEKGLTKKEYNPYFIRSLIQAKNREKNE